MGKKKYVAYVGTYTHGTSKGIQVYDVDVENGTLTERSEVEVSNASHLAVSKNGKYLYSIEDEGVAVFERDENGDLSRINSVDINGMRGCYLATDVDGRYLYVAGYHDGKVTVVHTHKDGRLGSVMDGVFHKGLGSVAERNFRPHVNCVRPTPDNKYLCAVDNGIDQVKIYRINKKKDKLELVDILRCPRESGPRIIRFSDDGRFAYLLFELSNEVKVYSYDGSGKNPEFQLLQSITTLGKEDANDAIHNAASGMSLSADGKYLFCTTAGENTVTMYAVDQETDIDTCQVEADAIIDFSSAKATDKLLEYSAARQIPVVLCSTGLSEEQLAKVEETSKKVAVLKSANMSLGINTLLKLVQDAAKVLATAGFDMEIVEKHHRLKVDAPSGTALALADSINEAMDNKYHYVYDRSQKREKRDDKEIGISAVRGGTIVGEHEIIFAGQDEVIEFKHTAYSKAIFGKGAVEAAKFLAGKPAGRYDMSDVIG